MTRPITWGSGLRLTDEETALAERLGKLTAVRREAVIFLASAVGVLVDGRRARGGKPSTLPPAWAALADACGGVEGLAVSVGVSARTVHRWGQGGAVSARHADAVRELAGKRGVPSPV